MPSLLLLAFLAEDELARVLHALALVGLGAAIVADLGSHLADHEARERNVGGEVLCKVF